MSDILEDIGRVISITTGISDVVETAHKLHEIASGARECVGNIRFLAEFFTGESDESPDSGNGNCE